MATLNKVKIDESSINSLVKAASYAVRGKIVIRSAQLAEKLKQPNHGLPFKKIIACNIGNPHSLNQKPITYMRNVLSVVMNPSLKDQVAFPKDVVRRATNYLSDIPGVGAYSESQGMAKVRADVAAFLNQRDGFPGNPANIFITNGASEGVRLCMQTVLREGGKDGILTPIPQYPLYSALTTLLDGVLVPYYLDESQGWSCKVENLQQSLAQARQDGVTVRSLVVINPGNPTGQVLTEGNMRQIVEFCANEGICLMADEVYQENIWKPNAKFVSFRKVAHDMGFKPESNDLQMISFHSISKGFLGECGLRGGYFELHGIPDSVKQEIYKLASISLCSNTIGQIATGLMVNEPKQGDESYAQFQQEKEAILQSMKRRAGLLSKALNKIPGISCTEIEGAMYAFPTIRLPAKAIEEAKRQGVEADEFYCMQLLEETGIVVVPGSGFKQVEGTLHFRTTILPQEDDLETVTKSIADFQAKFVNQYK